MSTHADSRDLLTHEIQRLVKPALAGLFILSFGAQAAPLNLTLNNTPDIVSTFINVNYNATTDSLVASGTAMALDDDGSSPAETISSGTFNLSATIDASGALGGGTLSIGGTVAALGFNSGTLLTGTLTQFGFPDAGGDPLEFLFTVTGGDAAELYGASSIPSGIILSDSGFSGGFTADFSSNIGVANTAPVPLPGAIWALGSGLLGLMCIRRRQRHT